MLSSIQSSFIKAILIHTVPRPDDPRKYSSCSNQLSLPANLLLAVVRTSLPNIGHDLLRVLGNLIEISGGNGSLVKERGDKSNTGGTVLQVVSGIVQIDSRGGVDAEEGQGRGNGLDPVGSAGDTGEELLQRSAVAVRIDELGRGLTSRNANDVACRTPFND